MCQMVQDENIFSTKCSYDLILLHLCLIQQEFRECLLCTVPCPICTSLLPPSAILLTFPIKYKECIFFSLKYFLCYVSWLFVNSLPSHTLHSEISTKTVPKTDFANHVYKIIHHHFWNGKCKNPVLVLESATVRSQETWREGRAFVTTASLDNLREVLFSLPNLS